MSRKRSRRPGRVLFFFGCVFVMAFLFATSDYVNGGFSLKALACMLGFGTLAIFTWTLYHRRTT